MSEPPTQFERKLTEHAKLQQPPPLGDFVQLAVEDELPTIRLYPDPVLNTVCEPVRIANFDRYWAGDLFTTMLAVMNAANGKGLAANQIGVTKCAIVINSTQHGILRLLNPRIASRSGNRVRFEERCLSVPGVSRKVYRNWRIKLAGYDVHGTPRIYDLRGDDSSCAQHEVDHLLGKTLMDYAE